MGDTGDEEPGISNDDLKSASSLRQRKQGSIVDPNFTTSAAGFEMNNNHKSEPKTQSNEKELTKSIAVQREEYTRSLNLWIQQCYHWHYFRTMNQLLYVASNPGFNVNIQQRRTTPAAPASIRPTGQTYVIPTLWKRAAAELIDFVFLLLIKVMTTYLVLDYMDFVDQNKYEFSLTDEDFDAYHLAYEWSSEIIIIEMIHRLIVVVFETLFLYRRRNPNRPGGATPGKLILGLKVVSCSQINDLPNGTVQIFPAEDIGIWRSLLRALIKNVSSVFFLPSSLTVFISNHNRAAYDFVAKSIVVEEITNANVQQRVN